MIADLVRRSFLLTVLADALGHFNDDDGWSMASHVALSSLIALFPVLIFVVALAAFLGAGPIADYLVGLLFETWPDAVAGPLAREVQSVLTVPRGDILTLSIAVAVYIASGGVEALRTALNRAYRVIDARSFLWRRLQSIVFVILGAFLMVGVALFGIVGPLIRERAVAEFPVIASFGADIPLIQVVLTPLILVAGLVLCHVFLPAKRPPIRFLWPGIATTLVLWVIAATAFAAYLQRFSTYVSTYAGLAGVMTALFFLYLIALVFIFGAELNASVARIRRIWPRRLGRASGE